MKKVLLFIFSALIVFSTSTLAQETTITGTVSDASGSLPAVTVQIKGTTSGTVADFDGNYTITANQGDILVYSFVGFTTQEITVGSQTVINVTMVEDVAQLAEIVVIGYGQTTVKDATGSVAAVSAEDFNEGVISSPEQLIQGKTAGVQITSTSGAPGAGVELRIRGTNSVRSNNNPLFVVDGVPLGGGNTSAATADLGFGSNPDSNPLTFLNPADIASISVLKDASSAAIYGSRGANGVVFITTKKGRGAGAIEFGSTLSFSGTAKRYPLLKANEEPYFLSGVGQYGGDSKLQDYGANTDWQDYIFRTGISNKQHLGYSRGYTNGTIRASFGYEDQQGIIEESGLKRISGMLMGTRSLMDNKLNLSLKGIYSNVNMDNAPVNGSAGFQGDILGAAYSANPTWPTDEDFDAGGQIHPGNFLKKFQGTSKTDRAIVNFTADYKILDGLIFKATYGMDWSSGETVSIANAEGRNLGDAVFGNGLAGLGRLDKMSHLGEFTVNYNKKFGNSHLDIVAGYSIQSFRSQGLNATGWGFNSLDFNVMEADFLNGVEKLETLGTGDFIQQFGLTDDLRGGTETNGAFVNALIPTVETQYFSAPSGINVSSISGDRFDNTDYLQSYFGRVNYTLSDKYLVTVTVRADGSSRFGTDNRTGIFPSGAVAWKVHEEGFMPDAFSTLKVRGGYGVVGNQDGLGYGNYVRRERYGGIGIGNAGEINIPGLTTTGTVEPGLKWEETKQLSIGLDFGFFGEKLFGSFDYYDKETSDILIGLIPAQPSATDRIFRNFPALVTNEGWEFMLGGDVVSNDDALFTITGNVSHNDNLITDFAGQIPAGTIRGQGLSEAFAQMLAEGQPLFSYYVREFAGFDKDGQPIRDNQKFVGKSALPVWNAGLSLRFSYKNFNVSAYMSGQFDFWIYNNTRNAFFTAGAINNARNVTEDVLTSGESGSAEAAVSERFLEKGDFVRMQDLSIGYNVPVEGSNLFQSLRFTISAQNLFLITDYSGLDPEVSSQPGADDLKNGLPTAGIDYTAYPRARTFSIGLNAKF